MKTAYDELGVRPDAEYETIKAAYLGAAKLYHPDTNSSDSAAETHFKRINAAHDILKNPIRRAAYDQLLQYRHRLVRRERIVTVITFAGCCLAGAALAIGNTHLLQRWVLERPSLKIPVVSGVAARKMETAAIPVKPTEQQGDGRGENGGDVAVPVAETPPPERNAPATASGWGAGNPPPTVPDPTSAAEEITPIPTQAMTDQRPAGQAGDEMRKADPSDRRPMIAGRASDAGSAIESPRARRTRATIPLRGTAKKRRLAMHPDRRRRLASYDGSNVNRNPGSPSAPRFHQTVYLGRWNAWVFCPLR